MDTALYLETPEGAEVELHPAGLVPRATAFAIDELLRWTIILASALLLGSFGRLGAGVISLVLFATYWGYGILFEVFNNGVTPGKRNRGLRVVHDNGTPVRLPASVLRNLVLTVDVLPGCYFLGIISLLLTQRFQRLGDLAAGTIVVHDQRSQNDNVAESAAAPAPVPLRPEDELALVEYLERVDQLSGERAAELAVILAVPFDATPATARSKVTRVATGLRGNA